MAGFLDGFDPDDFRAEIGAAMTMGLDPDPETRITFLLPPLAGETGGSIGFDPRKPRPPAKPQTVQVACAVEYRDGTGQLTNLGILDASRLVVTLLDEQYEQVKDATAVVANGDRYELRRQPPVKGLGSVAIHTMIFEAVAER